MSADEAAANAAYLARMEAESPFYTKKQVVVGAALASRMCSIASAVPPPAAATAFLHEEASRGGCNSGLGDAFYCFDGFGDATAGCDEYR